jgi:glycosyltransferase involved in cell wall biosynthesis
MKVAFVYSGGRERRGSAGPSDFFYGARELGALVGYEVECIDLDHAPADRVTALVGRVLGNWLPPRTSADWIARCQRALPRLREVDVVVATATEISFGLAIWKALGFFRKPLVGILCGAVNYPITSEIRRRFVASLINKFQPVLFADSELPEIERRFGLPGGLVSVGWFGVDNSFWTLQEEGVRREGVLAVGNDSRRDFDTLVEAAKFLPEIRFTIITRREKPRILPPNVEWRRGDWKEAPVADQELRALYQQAACVVVPLEECIQPSGQSVAMQAMMCGAPVVHTKTAGWWGAGVIRDRIDVELVAPGDGEALARAIKKSLQSDKKNRARESLLAHAWTASGFAQRLSKVIEGAASDKWNRLAGK